MAQPISLAEAKVHLRVDTTADDNLIEDSIVAAREWAEDYTGLVLTRREVTETLPAFSARMRLRAWPIVDDEPILVSYRDTSGVNQSIENAELNIAARPGLIFPFLGQQWPWHGTVDGSIYVTFTAGYAGPAEIPKVIKQAMLIMVTAFYEDREGGEMFGAAESSAMKLCRRYKRRTL